MEEQPGHTDISGHMPPPEKWVDFMEVARMMGTSLRVVERARNPGRKSTTGDTVTLVAWKTIRGWVTTLEEIHRFHRRLNS